MNSIKLTTWNVEWIVDAVDVDAGRVLPGTRRRRRRMPRLEEARAKLGGIAQQIGEMDPDILFLSEAVPGAGPMAEFTAKWLPMYRLVTRENEPDAAYAVKGEQWL